MSTQGGLLRRVLPDRCGMERRRAIEPETLSAASEIVERVRREGENAVRAYAERFGERAAGDPLVLDRSDLSRALEAIDAPTRALLERVAGRIERFARAQLDAIGEVDIAIPGGRAGHRVIPVEAAACYAPAGRYPLPSSVLMTAVTARVAGCSRVVVASPSTDPVMLASAAIAGADEYLAVGGAHAVAALAYGFEEFSPCDVIAGPGNKWVTAAKFLVSGEVGIDMLAGPSELLVIADDSADAATVAADLLAQAEHDDDAVPMLVTTSEGLADAVESELFKQLETLPTAATARRALINGFRCVVRDMDQACEVSDRIGAEHVEIMTADARSVASRLRNAGGIFLGPKSAEVLGDYGAGPNHTLPTGGTARFRAGLSVSTFLRLRTWIEIENTRDAGELFADAEAMARIERLEAHARAASVRSSDA